MQQKWAPNSCYISWTFLWRILFPVMGQICRRKGQEINAKRKKCNQSWLCLKQVVSFHWILASIDFVSFYLITANRLFLLLLCPRNTPALEALTNISEESLVHFLLNSLWVLTSGFPGGSVGKESACNTGDRGSVPGLGRSLEKEMATHSSILAWRIPWTEEPGGLQSMGRKSWTQLSN